MDDRLNAPATREEAAEEHRFPCPACGSDLRFSPEGGTLVCDHCGHAEQINDISSGELRELDFRAAVAEQLPQAEMEETRVLQCDSCGAQVEFDGVTHARECPFCASPVVTDTGLHRHIKPKGLLPFALTEKEARSAMTRWLGSLWFAPSGLQDFAQKGRKMQGIYVPYWTYDADTRSTYRGERGTYYYVTEEYTNSKGETERRRVRKVRWTPTSGRVSRWFDDVLVLASRSLPKRYTDALEPWELSAMEPYMPEYLAGFRAEGYAVDLQDGYDEAREVMDAQIRHDVKFDIGGDRQRIHAINTSVSDVTFKHVLLPVWLAAYKYRGKTFRFVVNGRSGRVQGERPWSTWKIVITIVIGLLIAGIIGYVLAQPEATEAFRGMRDTFS